jgi:hypothetical protein
VPSDGRQVQGGTVNGGHGLLLDVRVLQQLFNDLEVPLIGREMQGGPIVQAAMIDIGDQVLELRGIEKFLDLI